MITIITDASHCPDTLAGGWACWIVCDGQRYKHSARLKNQYVTAWHAEAAAIINSCVYLNKQALRFDNIYKLLIQSDCLSALTHFEKAVKNDKGCKLPKDLLKKWQSFYKSLPQLEFRHVEGHQCNSRGARYYVNNWVDREAKKHMRSLRQEFQIQQEFKDMLVEDDKKFFVD